MHLSASSWSLSALIATNEHTQRKRARRANAGDGAAASPARARATAAGLWSAA